MLIGRLALQTESVQPFAGMPHPRLQRAAAINPLPKYYPDGYIRIPDEELTNIHASDLSCT